MQGTRRVGVRMRTVLLRMQYLGGRRTSTGVRLGLGAVNKSCGLKRSRTLGLALLTCRLSTVISHKVKST